MILKRYKPTTPSQRHLIRLNNKILNKIPLFKFKLRGKKLSAGKNFTGQIVSYHKGGGHKQKYRDINFYNKDLTGIVLSIEYDPNRTANIIGVFDFKSNNYGYLLAPINIKIGNIIIFGNNAKLNLGHCLKIKNVPIGSFIYNIAPKKKKAQLSRSAGTFSELIKVQDNYCILKLSSGEFKKISNEKKGSLGIVSNKDNFLTTKGKAGRSRWLNIRPIVRGVAMNPIDHPHGGGEGKTSGGRSSVTPWGKPTKNQSKKKL